MADLPSMKESHDLHLSLITDADSKDITEVFKRLKTAITTAYVENVPSPERFRIGGPGYRAFQSKVNKAIRATMSDMVAILGDSATSVVNTVSDFYTKRGFTVDDIATIRLNSIVIGSANTQTMLNKMTANLKASVMGSLVASLNTNTKSSFIEVLKNKLVQDERGAVILKMSIDRGAAILTEGKIAVKPTNAQFMAYKRYNATFENTCARCVSYDGCVYVASGGIYLPQHPNCRCFYTFFMTKKDAENYKPKDWEANFDVSRNELQAMFGKNLGGAIYDGKLSINDVVKPTLNRRGEIVDVQQKKWTDFKGKL